MKRKILAFVFCIFVILVSVFVPYFFRNNNTDTDTRYHQHLMAKLRPEDEVDDGTFNTHLPLLCIETGGKSIPGKPKYDHFTGEPLRDDEDFAIYTLAEDGQEGLLAQLNVIDHEDTVNRPDDVPDITSKMRIHVRGRSSRYFDKNNYSIRLVDDDGNNRNEPLLGMDAHHEWALHGPIMDKTLIRNYMWYNISGEIMGYAPNVRFCEVMIDGEYKGLYLLTETLTAGVKSGRLPLSVTKKNESFSGYLLRLDMTNNANMLINTFSGYSLRRSSTIEIEYPGEKNLTEGMKEEINEDFSAFEKMLYSYDYDSWEYGYFNSIDRQSFIDYFLINEFTSNYDAGGLSTYIYKDIDGRFRMSVWDFNSACDNYVTEMQAGGQHFKLQDAIWFEMLIKDEYFTDALVKRYFDLRKNYLSTEYLDNYIDDVIEYLGPAIERNYEVWGYSFEPDEDMLIPTERNPRNYDEAVNQMKEYIEERGNWMDSNIDALRHYSNEAKVKKFNEEAN